MTRVRSPITVVTGAAGLIGSEVCRELDQQGSRVVAVDSSTGTNHGIDVFRADITDPAAIASVCAEVTDIYGRVDRLVHAAALTARTPGVGVSGELALIHLDVWRRLIDVNLTGALICVQQFLELLKLSADPKVLLVGSIQGLVPTMGTGAYGVSKAALAGLTRQLAAELAGARIAVNMLSPGPIAGPDHDERSMKTKGDAPATRGPTPMERFGTPAEVARAVAAILGESFSYMTGAVIPIDGGEHLRPRPGLPPVQSGPEFADHELEEV